MTRSTRGRRRGNGMSDTEVQAIAASYRDEDIGAVLDSVDDVMEGLSMEPCPIRGIPATARTVRRQSGCTTKEAKEASDGIRDALRYTMVLRHDTFADGYARARRRLEGLGYVERRCKNFYRRHADGRSPQKSVQCVYESPDGHMFELQYHTVSSLQAKAVSHRLYERQRRGGTTSDERRVLEARMGNLFGVIPDPDGVMGIGEHDDL